LALWQSVVVRDSKKRAQEAYKTGNS